MTPLWVAWNRAKLNSPTNTSNAALLAGIGYIQSFEIYKYRTCTCTYAATTTLTKLNCCRTRSAFHPSVVSISRPLTCTCRVHELHETLRSKHETEDAFRSVRCFSSQRNAIKQVDIQFGYGQAGWGRFAQDKCDVTRLLRDCTPRTHLPA